jgi:epsilon-lactone hydrolase
MSLQSFVVKRVVRKMAIREKDFVLNRKKTDELCGAYPVAKDITFKPVHIGGIAAEWSSTSDAPKDKLIIFLHGGGYCTGSITAYRHFTSTLAKSTGIRTLCIEYRLAPESPFPAALEDVLSVYRSLLADGISSENIILAGDSAGGGLCLAVVLALRDKEGFLPAALTLFSPWTDLTMTSESIKTKEAKDPMVYMDDLIRMADAYTKGQDVRNPLISPRFGRFHGFPPVFMHTGTDEMLLDDSINVAEKAKAEGVDVTFKIWKGMFHIFTIFSGYTPEGKKSLKEASEYIRQHLRM